ncbi:hypothetical protein B0H13DRAFT_1585604, partial [Mycena leptocephala]
LEAPACRMGCDAIEDMHHIFVKCPRYTEWRSKATNDILLRTRAKLTEKELEEADAYSVYYLGHIPPIDALVPRNNDLNGVTRSRLIHHFASDWHTACIRLAGRIWGDWQKEISKRTNSAAEEK